MTRANILPSLGEGFKLIVRAPLAVLVWGAITLVANFLPLLILWAFVGPAMADFYGALATNPEAAADMEMPAQFTLASALIQLCQLVLTPVSAALVYAGIYRAVLRPEDRGFGYVKFSADEFNVGVTIVVLYIFMLIAAFVGVLLFMIPVGIGIALAATGGAAALAAILPFILIIGLGILFAWLYARFGMALPMSFAEKRICIFEGWAFTRGYSGPLIGMAVLQVLIIAAIVIAMFMVVFAVFAGSFAAIGLDGVDTAEIESLFSDPQQLFQRFLPAILAVGAVYFLLMFLMQPIVIAPWAKAYQLIAEAELARKTEIFTEGE